MATNPSRFQGRPGSAADFEAAPMLDVPIPGPTHAYSIDPVDTFLIPEFLVDPSWAADT